MRGAQKITSDLLEKIGNINFGAPIRKLEEPCSFSIGHIKIHIDAESRTKTPRDDEGRITGQERRGYNMEITLSEDNTAKLGEYLETMFKSEFVREKFSQNIASKINRSRKFLENISTSHENRGYKLKLTVLHKEESKTARILFEGVFRPLIGYFIKC